MDDYKTWCLENLKLLAELAPEKFEELTRAIEKQASENNNGNRK